MNADGSDRIGPISRGFLLVLVTVTGAVVLALEVLGTRVIGTHYGSSLFVWAALITVTLVCLSIGYWIGGRLADRLPRAWMLCVLVMLAGASVLLVPWMTAVLAPVSDALGLAWGAIASAGALFFLPLTLLAMAGPYVIRLRARSVAAMGSTSGAVYALSTIGSVAGALAVSLWMIPTIGTRLSLLICSGVLIGVGAVGLVVVSRGRAILAVVLIGLPWPLRPRHEAFPGELYHTESAYGDLSVLQREVEGRGLHRFLMVNGIMQTGMPMDIDLVGPGEILQTDSYYLELLPYFYSDLAAGRKGILIGLAGGMFPRVMEFYDIDWTAVEIDVKVAELAKAYFGYRGRIHNAGGEEHPVDLSRFPDRASPVMAEHLDGADDEHAAEHAPSGEYRGRAVIQDGRKFIADHAGKVDFIVLDAYNSDTIPFHLITREFFEIIHSRLTGDGMLAINYIGSPGGDFVTDSLFRTLGEVFGRGKLRAYRTRDDETAAQVIIIFAFHGEPRTLLPLWQADAFGGADRLSYDLTRRRVKADRPAGTIITDDRNPIDLARAQTALAWRRDDRAAALVRPGRSGE
ncbi:MAG: fused MFS/spermidine synthase [Phycisphaerae bacterium]